MHKCLSLIFLALLCACQSRASARPGLITPASTASPPPVTTSTSAARPSPPPTLSVTPPPDQTEQQAWGKSAHAQPAAGTATLLPPEGAAQMSAAVPCTDCHQKNQDGTIAGSMAWWDEAGKQYQPVVDSNQLCQKCHDQLAPAGVPNAGSAIHAGFQCTACHDPHTTAASCSNASCHTNVRQTNDMPPSTPAGGHPFIGGGGPFCGGSSCHPAATAAASQPRSVHGGAHANVTCQACHAAGALKVGPDKEKGTWVTWQTINQSGSPTELPYFPHVTQPNVDCQRCHFSNNPWDLPPVTSHEFQK